MVENCEFCIYTIKIYKYKWQSARIFPFTLRVRNKRGDVWQNVRPFWRQNRESYTALRRATCAKNHRPTVCTCIGNDKIAHNAVKEYNLYKTSTRHWLNAVCWLAQVITVDVNKCPRVLTISCACQAELEQIDVKWKEWCLLPQQSAGGWRWAKAETSGVGRIWCQEGHMQKLLGFYRRQLSK